MCIAPGLVCADACRDAALGASLRGDAVAFAAMPDGSAGASGAAGLNDDECDGDEREDGFHNLPFARRGFFGRMIFHQRRKKTKRQVFAKRASEPFEMMNVRWIPPTKGLAERETIQGLIPPHRLRRANGRSQT